MTMTKFLGALGANPFDRYAYLRGATAASEALNAADRAALTKGDIAAVRRLAGAQSATLPPKTVWARF